ncbi:MAG: AgmX/PglI C-terminal domain-containing protein [Myxococcales bacterium]|nr:AgmX/PglI C-terminal domain-containing protein [Myxococcales bacterium]
MTIRDLHPITRAFTLAAAAALSITACDAEEPEAALERDEAVEIVDEDAPELAAAPKEAAPASEDAPVSDAVKAEFKGELDPEIIRRIVRAHINEIRHCYNQGLVDDPTLAGRVVIAFTIDPEGKVAEAAADEVTISPEVAECSRVAVQRWLFPKPRGGGSVSVRYPFVLEPG